MSWRPPEDPFMTTLVGLGALVLGLTLLVLTAAILTPEGTLW